MLFINLEISSLLPLSIPSEAPICICSQATRGYSFTDSSHIVEGRAVGKRVATANAQRKCPQDKRLLGYRDSQESVVEGITQDRAPLESN